MTAYKEALRRFRSEYAYQAVLATGGNVCAAARAAGMHRNRLTDWLRVGGYTPQSIKTLFKRYGKKTVQSVGADGAERRIA